VFPELALIVRALEEADGTAQSFGRACEAAASSCQPGEVVPQIGVRALDHVGLALARRNLVRIPTWVHQVLVSQALVRVIDLGFGHSVDQPLAFFPGEALADPKRENAAGEAVYDRGEEEELPLFRCMAYNSSISTILLLEG
jgi:hypothetical protein